MNPYIEETCAV